MRYSFDFNTNYNDEKIDDAMTTVAISILETMTTGQKRVVGHLIHTVLKENPNSIKSELLKEALDCISDSYGYNIVYYNCSKEDVDDEIRRFIMYTDLCESRSVGKCTYYICRYKDCLDNLLDVNYLIFKFDKKDKKGRCYHYTVTGKNSNGKSSDACNFAVSKACNYYNCRKEGVKDPHYIFIDYKEHTPMDISENDKNKIIEFLVNNTKLKERVKSSDETVIMLERFRDDWYKIIVVFNTHLGFILTDYHYPVFVDPKKKYSNRRKEDIIKDLEGNRQKIVFESNSEKFSIMFSKEAYDAYLLFEYRDPATFKNSKTKDKLWHYICCKLGVNSIDGFSFTCGLYEKYTANIGFKLTSYYDPGTTTLKIFDENECIIPFDEVF